MWPLLAGGAVGLGAALYPENVEALFVKNPNVKKVGFWEKVLDNFLLSNEERYRKRGLVELDDSTAKYTGTFLGLPAVSTRWIDTSIHEDPNKVLNTVPLSSILDYPELFESHPELKDKGVLIGLSPIGSTYLPMGSYITKNASGDEFFYITATKELSEKAGKEQLKERLLHEIQHYISKHDNIADGGLDTNNPFISNNFDMIKKLIKYQEENKLSKDESKFLDYLNSYREILSRDVGKRIEYTKEQRENIKPDWVRLYEDLDTNYPVYKKEDLSK